MAIKKQSNLLDTPPLLSQTIWGIVWEDHFPYQTQGGIKVELSNYDDVSAFMNDNYHNIYNTLDNPFTGSDPNSKKRSYYEVAGDFFKFNDDLRTIAIAVGNPLDWTGYYYRNVSIMPEYQGQGIYQEFTKYLVNILRQHGVERLEGDVAPSNMVNIRVMTKMGFIVSGINLSEKWGTVLRLTKYLLKERQDIFFNQFCSAINPLKDVK